MGMTSGRRFPASGFIRIAIALSGAAIAGLTLVPVASAATVKAVTPSVATHLGVTPDIDPLQCSEFTDGESYGEAYCPYPPGEFQVWITCGFGSTIRYFDGPWEPAGGGHTSYARCPTNWFYNSMGINTVD